MDLTTAEYWMREALAEARKAESEEEVPVGAVLLVNEKIVGRGHNNCIRSNDPTAHAEIEALRSASHSLHNYRLPGSILVVTLEPCVMCAGALLHARVEQVVFGAADPKGGSLVSCFGLADSPHSNHKMKLLAGVLEEECAGLLRGFFGSRR